MARPLRPGRIRTKRLPSLSAQRWIASPGREFAGIHDPVRIEGPLDRVHRGTARDRTLTKQPRQVLVTDRMMVRQRRAVRGKAVEAGAFDGRIVLELGPRVDPAIFLDAT